MSTREHFYNTRTGEFAVAFTTVHASKMETWALRTFSGGGIDVDSAYELADDNNWIAITKDNADLFIDAVHEDLEVLGLQVQRYQKIISVLEEILE